LADADEALCILEETLNDYELALNPSKTKIITLPWPTEKLAISELRTLKFREAPVAQHSDLLHYFDKARQNKSQRTLSLYELQEI